MEVIQLAQQIKIRIFNDGMIQADVEGVKGKKCTNYIKIIEDLLGANVIDSKYTQEYYETEEILEEKVTDSNFASVHNDANKVDNSGEHIKEVSEAHMVDSENCEVEMVSNNE